ncbi:hypothetical protein VITFI_CDS1522 [Vitreoscilla filiformis]|uniref:KilA-N domain-containing protein n=1 Tax=Vitreoscilla filiformis TaxID=63 RepID=A0A221KBS0_VITFI|nr:KilA-N domain-containing protein [Vitreoscilla filiformis]ASM75901.1 hypothetical protein VITFI_CDS0122 [Vitreoscilla filiformis]ASM76425.1 hypothetical protein VITFI_CDS0646 [Vitreoscilla filiformis]ASM76851.1 hypothetical protein VITFI_CDS1073 [Vitreoscilla filiformis]ASM77300.1 hypothetical protein VITFI_CDS1522 [Vitreoscilla filiformis]
MNDLSILNTAIRRDSAGRYCLNDLHKAAGNNNRHRPSLWLANKATKAQLAVLESEARIPALRAEDVSQGDTQISGVTFQSKAGIPALPISDQRGGQYESRGTFVCKELVYSYAMWISPEFFLKVVRAYDALMTGNYVKPLTQAEKYWFSRRPHWQDVRRLVFDGHTYAQVGQMLKRSATSVGYAIRRMIAVGLINPVEFIRLRYFPETAERLIAGNKQMCLNWGVAQ